MFRFYKKKGWNNEITSFDVTIVSEGDLIARGGYWNGDQWQETETSDRELISEPVYIMSSWI